MQFRHLLGSWRLALELRDGQECPSYLRFVQLLGGQMLFEPGQQRLGRSYAVFAFETVAGAFDHQEFRRHFLFLSSARIH